MRLKCYGFQETLYHDARVNISTFESTTLILKIGLDLVLQEVSMIWLSAKSNKAVPSPFLAICFFSNEIDSVIAEAYKSKDATEQITSLLRLIEMNPWVILTDEWMSNPQLLAAVENANDHIAFKNNHTIGGFERYINHCRTRQS